MDLPAHEDVLSQPTRAELFRVLTELKRPAGTEELAARMSLHPNGVRVHLERMLEAELVVRERSRQARGRPRDMWAVSPDARPGGDRPTAYADLGRWLPRVIQRSKTSMRSIEAAGREIGRELAPVVKGQPAEPHMHATLAAMGFQPRREVKATGTLTYRLCNCPYRDAVAENQEAICTMHRGMTRGLLDTLAPKTKLTGFVPRDPRKAGCLIELSGGLADESAG